MPRRPKAFYLGLWDAHNLHRCAIGCQQLLYRLQMLVLRGDLVGDLCGKQCDG